MVLERPTTKLSSRLGYYIAGTKVHSHKSSNPPQIGLVAPSFVGQACVDWSLKLERLWVKFLRKKS